MYRFQAQINSFFSRSSSLYKLYIYLLIILSGSTPSITSKPKIGCTRVNWCFKLSASPITGCSQIDDRFEGSDD
ncbi:hypothetical protein L2E82_12816 [Cichorium intybus]|uniref:Uncharacterized protein n=1 Tax=Cichorium intybus TaxID=13427 RepID=A0ACB9GI66_CICIN|nr:hypothetical protein L2E82_12816 [Cichorium intybus]